MLQQKVLVGADLFFRGNPDWARSGCARKLPEMFKLEPAPRGCGASTELAGTAGRMRCIQNLAAHFNFYAAVRGPSREGREGGRTP